MMLGTMDHSLVKIFVRLAPFYGIFCELHRTTHTHSTRTFIPYERTHANPIPMSFFEDWTDKFSRLKNSPQALRCRWVRRLPLKSTTPLNPRKFALTGSRT